MGKGENAMMAKGQNPIFFSFPRSVLIILPLPENSTNPAFSLFHFSNGLYVLLTLSKATDFRHFHSERVCRRQF